MSYFFLAWLMIFSYAFKINADTWLPPQQLGPAFTGGSPNIVGGTDGSGNALVSWLNNGTVEASYFNRTTLTWSSPQILGGGNADAESLAMDATGTGLLVWGEDNGTVLTSHFSNGVWTTPSPDPLSTFTGPGFDFQTSTAMNGSGGGVTIWLDPGASTIFASFFSGSWGPIMNLGPGTGLPEVAYSANGTAVAIWDNAGIVQASQWGGITWSTPVAIGMDQGVFNLALGIDAAGNAMAAWNNGNVIETSYFNGNVWGVATPQSQIGNIASWLSLAMAPGGTGVLVWREGPIGQSKTFNGMTFSPLLAPFTINAADPFAPNMGVSVDSLGNALVIYDTATPQLLSQQLPLGSTSWINLLTIADNSSDIFTQSALSLGGRGFAFYEEFANVEALAPFASALIPDPIIPPVINGLACNNKFARQSERLNVITWTPSPSPNIIAYLLSRNGVLIAVVPFTGAFEFIDRLCQREEVTYTVVAVNFLGNLSPLATITLP